MSNQDFVCVPVPSEQVARVLHFLQERRSEKTLNEMLHLFIEYGLDNAEWKIDEFDNDIFCVLPKDKPEEGYLWTYDKKSLFLPNGTQIIRKYKGNDLFARVEDRTFIYAERTYNSPAELARALSGNTSVNAWIVLYIKRPGDTKWRLASELADYS